MKCHRCPDHACYRDGRVCRDGSVIKELKGLEAEIMRSSSKLEAEHYCKLTRLEETVEFFKLMGFKRVGIAFCIGLADEASFVAKVYEKNGFEVFSAICKIGSVDKEELGFPKIRENQAEASCNPVLQAQVLNEKKTDVNVIIGLCVGHDMLFQMHSNAPCTTLIVKDRVLAHNPAGAIYSSYHRRRILSEE